jgi:hypothetical protein
MGRIGTAIVSTAVSVGIVLADEHCPGTAFEREPTLVSDLGPLKGVVRSAGYRGRMIVTVVVTESGRVRYPKIVYAAVPLELNIEVTTF